MSGARTEAPGREAPYNAGAVVFHCWRTVIPFAGFAGAYRDEANGMLVMVQEDGASPVMSTRLDDVGLRAGTRGGPGPGRISLGTWRSAERQLRVESVPQEARTALVQGDCDLAMGWNLRR